MAFIRCESGGGGGIIKEKTTLWTNPNPTSSQSAGTATLSRDYDDFALIGITFKSNTTSAESIDVVMYASDFAKSALDLPYPQSRLCADVLISSAGGGHRVRPVYLTSSSDKRSVSYGSCVTATTGTGSTTNSNCIITEIFGVGNV